MFLICGEEIKVHCVFDESILSDVISNLETRFGKNIISEKKQADREFVWDPGGTILNKDIMLRFRIDEQNSIYCRSQHWPVFKELVLSQLSSADRYNNKFYKLHGHLFSACLSKQQRDRLLNEVKINTFKCDEIAKISVQKFSDLDLNIIKKSKLE